MLVGSYYEGMELHREDKIVYARFLVPHAVLSTARAGGGYREDLKVLLNHQACEPAGPGHAKAAKGYTDPGGYMRDVCAIHDLPGEESAGLSTAANMRLVQVEAETHKDLTVVAAVTGGVEGNAGRAGDPATGHEGKDGYEPIPRVGTDGVPVTPGHGTINTLLFSSLPLTKGALVRAVMMAAEAKTAGLQELNVNSRYSDGLATGTGTDQIGVAARFLADRAPLSSAGKHSKLGELIGVTVKRATKGVLIRQNGMTPDRQCSVKILMERFFVKDGYHRISGEELAVYASAFLPEDLRALFVSNRKPVFHDPVNAAATAALVHLRDEFAWGILPASVWPEVMSGHAAQLAAAVSGKYDRVPAYRERLKPFSVETDNRGFANLVSSAIAMGFAEKWELESKE
ncbi:MAG: adenosylcobinamide amidohydrolase [Deltaproteobacteria bacterium]|jgi:adenosylcobinamide amidohydrolase|nr:adenosylcobinamide amidohydrolase [Deltaproteobacteria bacterium]